jgi:hypothetical protein
MGRRLPWIWGDDFQVATLTQRKKRIARATSGMDPANVSAHTYVLLDKVDAALKIVGTEQDVVERTGHENSLRE